MNLIALLLSSASYASRAFMNHHPLETVIIETDAGPVMINKSEYDAAPDQYTLHVADDAPAAPAALRTDGPTLAEFIAAGYDAANYPPTGYAGKEDAPQTPAPAVPAATIDPPANPLPASMTDAAAGAAAPQLMVMKDGKKHFVVDPAGVKVARDGIDAKGYTAEQDAWNAILALPR